MTRRRDLLEAAGTSLALSARTLQACGEGGCTIADFAGSEGVHQFHCGLSARVSAEGRISSERDTSLCRSEGAIGFLRLATRPVFGLHK